MKRWIGRWLMGISLFHTVVAGLLFGKDLVAVASRGAFHTIGTDPQSGAAIWFFLFGTLLFLSGLALDSLERSSVRPIPKAIGWSLLTLGVLGVTLMPVSGFWLALPPAWAILVAKTSESARSAA